MKQLINQKANAVGKTVEKVTDADQYVAIHFTDGTAMVIEAENTYDGIEASIAVEMEQEWHAEVLGLCTHEERVAEESRKEAARLERHKEQRRQVFEKLKQEFGDQPAGNCCQ